MPDVRMDRSKPLPLIALLVLAAGHSGHEFRTFTGSWLNSGQTVQ